jgi:hypothetical protein
MYDHDFRHFSVQKVFLKNSVAVTFSLPKYVAVISVKKLPFLIQFLAKLFFYHSIDPWCLLTRNVKKAYSKGLNVHGRLHVCIPNKTKAGQCLK